MDSAAIDSRLLECLQVLVAECHVTRAAERLGMSQPKLSELLRRLRKITGDPLLVRTSHGMVPTDLARNLSACSSDFLTRWNGLIQDATTFDPASATNTFRVVAGDFLVQLVLQDVIHEIRRRAPGVSISIDAPSYATMRTTSETGEIDLFVGSVPQPPPNFFISQLLTYRMCVVAAADHPDIGDTLSVEQYARSPHVALTFGHKQELTLTERYLEKLLLEHGIRRHIGVYVPTVLVVPGIVGHSDLIATVPRRVIERTASDVPLKMLEPPLDVPPLSLSMLWHGRKSNDMANRWLREIIREVAARAWHGV